jgi:DEAD/DEAH box helicase domain-containing protein
MPVHVVEAADGRVLGTVDAAAAHSSVHRGAVHLHRGRTYIVRDLDLDASVALVDRADPDWTTTARDITDIEVLEAGRSRAWGEATVVLGTVQVTNQVVGYLRRRLLTGEVLGEEPLDLPPRHLTTTAVWWTLDAQQVAASGVDPRNVAGAAHAAEHAAIGLLPLFATCDRWDIGGVSTAMHRDTGRLTVFVYDGHPGGAGFAERGYAVAQDWLTTTRDAIASCACQTGCPSCVQSPKCGNGNEPLSKPGSIALLDTLLPR